MLKSNYYEKKDFIFNLAILSLKNIIAKPDFLKILS
jgi:hypothetical protein